ncbi:MAG: CGP-CTERM sorting domain-containing protein [Palaeococcus sp.]|uniref:CGP-CTERM sorting domain-containing protein n=1 Tax=Palaeococcus sp. (in: euryarchaeotes) TaxID=2820298 RepID=UPI0025F0ACB0|nr:CGP-CTERM sorting domain-containing protein [Palaeococcus sp. (in: euryarchaeotes)]MCD6559105.1 CGP-CTERM sorting domain-containing protein [Palaeococcus sp. (in: euryarchaeotes)]
MQKVQLEPMQCPEASCPPETAGLWWDVYYFDGSHLFFFSHYFKRPYFFYGGSWVFLNYTSNSLIFYRLNPRLKCIKELGKIGINYTEEVYFDFPLLYIRRNGKVEKYLIGRDELKPLYEDFRLLKQEARSVTITLDKKFIRVSNGTNSYIVPKQDIEQYLAFGEDVAYLKAVFLKDGVLFYYPAKVHADENRTQIKSLREIPLFFYNGGKLKVFFLSSVNQTITFKACPTKNVTRTKIITETKRGKICGPAFIITLGLMVLVLRRKVGCQNKGLT